jgi:autotransporter-associated beta strand protein
MPRFGRLPRLRYLSAALALTFAGSAHGGAVLFSYGAAAGDTKLAQGDDNFILAPFSGLGPAGSSVSMSLFGSTYNGIYVDNNGVLSFGQGLSSYTPDSFPSSTKTPALAAFWADVDTRTAYGGAGSVWYRTTQDAQQLASIKTLLSNSLLGLGAFNPTFAEVVTWDQVAGYHQDNLNDPLLSKARNTFQEVVISDSMQTYAIYLYPDNGIQWMIGTVSNGLNPNVGFDLADKTHFYNAVGSGTSAMANLPSLSNTFPANPGVQVYRVDGTGAVVAGGAAGAPVFALPSHTWSAASGGNWSSAANWGALVNGDGVTRSVPANTWVNGDSAVFNGSGTITVDTTVATPRLTVNSSGYTFTATSAANSLQIGSLTLPGADTSVTFAGSLVVLTHTDVGGQVWNGASFDQQSTLNQGQLTFTDNAVLVARDATSVNGASLHLKKAAQVQVYINDASTRASTLSFDASAGGVGGTLDLRGLSTTFGAISSLNAGAGRIVSSVAGGRLTVDFDNANSTFSGIMSGAASLTKAGSGTLTLSGANTYTGGTTLAGGALALGSSGALGTSGTISFSGGTLRYGTANATDYSGRFSTAAGQAFSIDTNGRDVSFASALSSSGGSLAKSGTGTLTLNGANNYSGATTVSGGTLKLGRANILASGSELAVASGATLNLNGNAQSVGALSGAGNVVLGAATVTVSGNGSSAFAGQLSGTGGLRKDGAGTLQLSGTSSYTGATTVAGGTLLVDGSAASSAFSVASGATLGGHGNVGKVTMAGTLAPGNSPGTLNTGDFTFIGGSSYAWQINNAEGGSGADLLAVNGQLTFAGNAAAPVTVRLQSLLQDNQPGDVFNFDALKNHSYVIATASGGIDGYSPDSLLLDASGFSNALHGGSWSLNVQGGQLALNFTAAPVPEPEQLGMLLAGLAAIGYAARRRRLV